jgi:hypothetical protein
MTRSYVPTGTMPRGLPLLEVVNRSGLLPSQADQ